MSNHKLEVCFNDWRYDQKPDDSPDFCWTAHFHDSGITAYADTSEKAIRKAVEMLKVRNRLEAKK